MSVLCVDGADAVDAGDAAGAGDAGDADDAVSTVGVNSNIANNPNPATTLITVRRMAGSLNPRRACPSKRLAATLKHFHSQGSAWIPPRGEHAVVVPLRLRRPDDQQATHVHDRGIQIGEPHHAHILAGS